MEALGLTNITGIAIASGLDATGYASKMLVGVQGDPAGILGILKAESARGRRSRFHYPKTPSSRQAVRMDLDLALAKRPRYRFRHRAVEMHKFNSTPGRAMEGQIGVKIRDDLLRPLGDVWCFSIGPMAAAPDPMPQILAVVKVRGRETASGDPRELGADRYRGPWPPIVPHLAQTSPKIKPFATDGHEIFANRPGGSKCPGDPRLVPPTKDLSLPFSPDLVQDLSHPRQQARLAGRCGRGGWPLKSDNPPVAIAYQDHARARARRVSFARMGLIICL